MDYLIYDLAIVLVLLFFLWRGYRRGFVLTLCSMLAIFVAFIGASIISSILAEPVSKIVEPVVTSNIHKIVDDYISVGVSSAGGAADHAHISLSELLQILEDSTLYHNLAQTFHAAVEEGAAELASNAIQSLAHFIAVQIARTVLFAIAFIAILIGWFFLSHTLDLVAKLPVLNSVNRWTGGALGLCKGALIVFIAVWLFKDSYIPQAAREDTFLLKFLSTFNPLSFFL